MQYWPVLSRIITVRLQEQLENNTAFPECARIVSRPAPFHKKYVSLAVLCVFTVSVLFTTVLQVIMSY